MEAEAQSFDAIFRRDVRYLVPVFQRRYTWDRERQWEPFWADVLEVVDAYVDAAGPNGEAPLGDELPTHFFGAIVVKLMQFGAGQLELREIIDGQQRLTTTQLLIGAAAQTLDRFGAGEQATELRSLSENRAYLTKGDPDAAFKVWPTKHDRDSFRAVMTGADPNPGDRPDRIAAAFGYFEEAITDWAEAVPETERDLHFQALEAVIRTQLRLVWIDLDKQDNAQVIFETLNDRGAPLNAIDLVKNFVFQHEHGDGGAEDLYERHWVWIEDDWWQKKIRLGRLDRVRADVFLQHWLQMRLGVEVNSDYLFKSFAKMFENDSPEVSSLIPEFADDARIYRSFAEQPSGTRRGQFFDRLEVLNTTTPYPLLLFLFKLPPEVLSAGQLDRCLEFIEDYLVRRMLVRGTTQGYNRLFTELVKDVRLDPSNSPEIIEVQLAKMEGGSRYWPRDEDVVTALTEGKAYGTGAIARDRLLDVLWEVERSCLRSDKHEDLPRPSGLQIEHIIPRAWTKNWMTPEGDSAEDRRYREREESINKLGNLTLVTDRLNPSMSNSGWSEKQKALTGHSLLAINQQLVSRYGERFDEASVRERGKYLAQQIVARWPGPEDR
ncbi:MAG TPA: DUF262 domain-containing protein [Solirubrobacterales bacterium]